MESRLAELTGEHWHLSTRFYSNFTCEKNDAVNLLVSSIHSVTYAAAIVYSNF